MTVRAITSLDEFKSTIHSGKPCVIELWAAWNDPSKAIRPVFKQLSEQGVYEAVEFSAVDADDQPAIAEKVGVTSLPTFVLYKGGEKVDTVVGNKPRSVEGLVRKAVSLA